ncbi:MAG: hypothetical protein PHS14_14815 [Elusimicrobia bacterium]|nr:hypothetical protein [Elusimicrobiota bacterium]
MTFTEERPMAADIEAGVRDDRGRGTSLPFPTRKEGAGACR